MEATTFEGKAVEILKLDEYNSLSLDENALSKILLDPRVCDNKVMLLSIAGAYRKGKSFLLNFFIRYLSNLNNGVMSDDWMGKDDKSLKGFNWEGGVDRVTSGILMWNEPYFISIPDKGKICILLMDTQGVFDSVSTLKESTTIFALSTMLSSVQIFNITANIQEDNLQHLQLFSEYGRLALENHAGKPFQSLNFLVRDWQCPKQHSYGFDGGKQLLDSRLKVTKNQPEEFQNVRYHMKSCFENIDCFLMPHPGYKIVSMPDFTGKLQELDKVFKDNMKAFTEETFNPSNIVVKKINNKDITGKELIEYFKTYTDAYKGTSLPDPKSLFDATAEATNLAAVTNATYLYTEEMEKMCGGENPYMEPDKLSSLNKECFHKAIGLFQKTKKLGGEQFSKKHECELEKKLCTMFEIHEENNISKREMEKLKNSEAVNKFKELYNSEMEKVCEEKTHIEPESLFSSHENWKHEAMQSFVKGKMGSDDFSKIYADRLEKDIDQKFKSIKENNISFKEMETVTNEAAVVNANALYTEEMEKVCGGENTYLESQQLSSFHEKSSIKAMDHFAKMKKGSSEFSKTCEINLIKKIEDSLNVQKKNNNSVQEKDKKHNFEVVNSSIELYNKEMVKECELIPYTEPNEFSKIHEKSERKAMDFFNENKKGSEKFSKTYADKLKKETCDEFEKYKTLNEKKKNAKFKKVIAGTSLVATGVAGVVGLGITSYVSPRAAMAIGKRLLPVLAQIAGNAATNELQSPK